MIPLRINGATRALAKNQKEFLTLHIRDEIIYETSMMTSLWEMTPKDLMNAQYGGQFYVMFWFTDGPRPALMRRPSMAEMACLNMAGRCILSIPGANHPPIWFGILSADETKQAPIPVYPLCAVGVQYAPELIDG